MSLAERLVDSMFAELEQTLVGVGEVLTADELVALVRDVPCKFNLIPFNSFPDAGLERSPVERVRSFAQRLADAGIVTTVRRTRGDDIDAACGQLAGEVQDRTRRVARERAIPIAVADGR